MINKVFLLFFFITRFGDSFKEANTIHFNRGTSGFVAVSNDSIWFGMDSKVTGDSVYHILKIGHTRDIYYSFAGNATATIDGKDVFNCYKIMEYYIEKGNGFTKSCDLLNDSIINLFTTLFYYGGEKVKPLFKSLFNFKRHVVEFVATGFINGIPLCQYRSYILAGPDENHWTMSPDDVRFNNGNPCFQAIGHADIMITYIHKNKLYFSGFKNVEEKIFHLIKMEADSSYEVGLPVDEVVLSKNSHKWYRRIKSVNDLYRKR